MKEKLNKVILVGAFHEVIELCEYQDYDIIGIFDNTKTGEYRGYKIIGNDSNLIESFKTYGGFPLIISPDQPAKRYQIVEAYRSSGYSFISLISSDSLISSTSTFGTGVLIQSKVNISANVVLGDFVRVNIMANIMHDSIVNQFTTIAPNAVLLGNTRIGSFTYIGANATILPGITIGDHVIIGAGSVVTKDVKEGMVVAGNPARVLQYDNL